MNETLTASNFYSALAVCVLVLHGLFIIWVVVGAILTRSRPILRWFRIGCLIWGNPYGAPSLAVPSDSARELAGNQSWRRAIPRWVSAALPG